MSVKEKIIIEELQYTDNVLSIIEKLEKFDYLKEIYIDYDSNTVIISSDDSLSNYQIDLIIEALKEISTKAIGEYKKLRNIVKQEHTFIDENVIGKDIETVNEITKKIIIKYQDKLSEYNVKSNIVKDVLNEEKEDHENEHEHNKKCEHGHKHHHDDCSCKHCHSHGLFDEEEEQPTFVGMIHNIIGVIIFITCLVLKISLDLNYLIFGFILSYLLIGSDIIINSLKGLLHAEFFSENMLMLIASVGAMCINEPIEGVMVILLYKIGEFLQDKATDKSKKSIKSLMELKNDTVTLSTGEIINVKDVNVGDIISIRVGEKIPLDGVIKSGSTDVDMKALTGESVPVYLDKGSEILSGSINLSKVIEVEVTKKDSDSTLSKLMQLVEDASNQQSKRQEFITKFARIYTPIVLIIACITGIIEYFFLHMDHTQVLNNVFTLLVISCPCALVISIPLAYFAGIGKSSSNGILVKGGVYLDYLVKNGYYVFDKTGTITKGNFKVSNVYPEEGITKDEVLEIIARVEQFSNHPIAHSIKEAVGNLEKENDIQVEEIGGKGLRVIKDGHEILVGNKDLMNINHIKYYVPSNIGTILYLAIDKVFYGSVVIVDEIKDDSAELIQYLNLNNETILLTGDTTDVAKYVGNKVGFKNIKSELLPKEKYFYIKSLLKKGRNVIYVGDGINDSPSLKLANVGICMGITGADSAKECADIVIVDDDISKVKDAIRIAKYTNKVITENIIFALLVKLAALVIGVMGLLEQYAMIIAIFADVGVCLLVILNTMRILKFKLQKRKKN